MFVEFQCKPSPYVQTAVGDLARVCIVAVCQATYTVHMLESTHKAPGGALWWLPKKLERVPTKH